jgi:anti-sigma factor ChrR (cupin superfamily)
MRGVERRMLDRIGEEVARATSIVRYAPQSHFSAHRHGGGEEFLVLEGVFEDQHGEYPVGSYIRNPPASAHTPGSTPGCILFVKLWQFAPEDRTHVRLDTGKMPFLRTPDRPGVELMPLFQDSDEYVRLKRWVPGAAIPLPNPGGMEVLVLEGSFEEGGERFEPQSWLRLPVGSTFGGRTGPAGCKVWIKAGHLRRAEPERPTLSTRNRSLTFPSELLRRRGREVVRRLPSTRGSSRSPARLCVTTPLRTWGHGERVRHLERS